MKTGTTFITYSTTFLLYILVTTNQNTMAQETFPMTEPGYEIENPRLIYVDENENFDLFIEENGCFHGFKRKADAETNSEPLYYQKTVSSFSLNESGLFDLKTYTPKSGEEEDFGIICLMDLNKDGKKDLIVYDSRRIYSLENKGNGVYGNLTKLFKLSQRANWETIHEAGLFTFLGFNDEKTYYEFFDLRDEAKKEKFVYKGQSYLITYLELANGDNYFVRNNNDGTISFIGKKTFDVEFINYHSYECLGASDFNNDGFPDMVSSQDHTLFVHYGQADNSLKTSEDLLDEYALLDDTAIFDSTKIHFYYSVESGKKQTLDYLEYGKLHITDMNNDQYADIIFHGEFFILFKNDKNGGFDPIPLGGPFDDSGYIVKDFNGDQLQDVLINAYDAVYLFLNRETAFEKILISETGYVSTMMACDADSDNDIDVLFTDGTDKLKWVENKGDKFGKETQWSGTGL